MARRRYQRGYLYLRGRKTSVWVGRWREDVMRSDGSVQRIRRSLVIGTRADFPTRRLAERQFETLLARITRRATVLAASQALLSSLIGGEEKS